MAISPCTSDATIFDIKSHVYLLPLCWSMGKGSPGLTVCGELRWVAGATSGCSGLISDVIASKKLIISRETIRQIIQKIKKIGSKARADI